MREHDQEGYQTLGWIINKSEQGLYLVVADEDTQKEIVDIYRRGAVKVYDYKRHPGAYSFRDLQEWADREPETQIFMVVNFHLAIQNEDGLKRLNFSRDMLEGLGKNFIFFVTPYGDDRLATKAYDFYSFVKLRIIFHNDETEEKEKELLSVTEKLSEEKKWKPEEAKQKFAEAYDFIEQAKEEQDKAHYNESVRLLQKAQEIKENLLGTQHLEIAGVQQLLADVYKDQGKYNEAELLYQESLQIRKKILEEEHPDTVLIYNNLAYVYQEQGKYNKAEELYQKSLQISKEILGEEHPNTATIYNNLAYVYQEQGKYNKAEELYQKSLQISKEVLGENHIDTAISYNNLAGIYENQGNYQKAEELYQKSLQVRRKILGDQHPDIVTSYNNLAYIYQKQGK